MADNLTPWMNTALQYVGLTEIVGKENAPEILRFFADTGNAWIKDDETAWCAAFVGSCLKDNGYVIPAGVSAVRAAEYNANIGAPVSDIVYGDIIQLNYDQKGVIDHVTFFYADHPTNPSLFQGLGGNQSNSVKLSNFKRSDIAGAFSPIKVATHEPEQVPVPTSSGVSAPPVAASPRIVDHGADASGTNNGTTPDDNWFVRILRALVNWFDAKR